MGRPQHSSTEAEMPFCFHNRRRDVCEPPKRQTSADSRPIARACRAVSRRSCYGISNPCDSAHRQAATPSPQRRGTKTRRQNAALRRHPRLPQRITPTQVHVNRVSRGPVCVRHQQKFKRTTRHWSSVIDVADGTHTHIDAQLISGGNPPHIVAVAVGLHSQNFCPSCTFERPAVGYSHLIDSE